MEAPITYIEKFATDVDYDAIRAAIRWEDRGVPRSEAYYADRAVPYTYGSGAYARTYLPHTDWSDLLADLKARVEAHCGQAFELLFCNHYADDRQHLGWHADDSPSVDDARPIPVVSFGSAREIWFRENGKGEVQKLLLAPGSLLLMHAGMQDTHQHRIPKAGRIVTPRVSLTFRGLAAEAAAEFAASQAALPA
jgi:alkylated DNA repair dioxygenase AlkB